MDSNTSAALPIRRPAWLQGKGDLVRGSSGVCFPPRLVMMASDPGSSPPLDKAAASCLPQRGGITNLIRPPTDRLKTCEHGLLHMRLQLQAWEAKKESVQRQGKQGLQIDLLKIRSLGSMQQYLEMPGVPHSTSGAARSTIT